MTTFNQGFLDNSTPVICKGKAFSRQSCGRTYRRIEKLEEMFGSNTNLKTGGICVVLPDGGGRSELIGCELGEAIPIRGFKYSFTAFSRPHTYTSPAIVTLT